MKEIDLEPTVPETPGGADIEVGEGSKRLPLRPPSSSPDQQERLARIIRLNSQVRYGAIDDEEAARLTVGVKA